MASMGITAETYLNYRALGRMYYERQGQVRLNSMFRILAGEPSRAASEELATLVDGAVNAGQSPESVIPPRTPQAGNGSIERFDTDEFEYVYIGGRRDHAPINSRGNSAVVMTPSGGESRRHRLARTYDVLELNVHEFMNIREPEKWVLDTGHREVQRQIKEQATRHVFTQQVYLKQLFFSVAIYVNSKGQILESSSGAAYSIPTGVAASHRSQLNTGSGDLITTAWDNPAADILGQLDAIQAAQERLNGEPLKYVFLPHVGRKWIRNNTGIAALYKTENAIDLAMTGDTFQIPGSPWVFVFSNATYIDAGGNYADFIPSTMAAITPELSGDWFLNAQGIEYVPDNAFRGSDAMTLLNSLRPTYGMFTYSKLVDNPVKLQVFCGVNFAYGFRNPNSVWVPTVDF